ncbi:P-loop NTPase fold protein [Paraoerskovia sediminicola]|nr:P-loop NTPase fold protein [Paraoerskovia sediminicola]
MTTAAKQGTNQRAVSEPVTLRSLGARYDPQHHGVYVTALQTAIDSEPSMRNIALTGAYGTGKSSVLSQIADLYEDRVLELSLSTVGPDIDETDRAPGDATASYVKTLRIQKEIVKQILYRDAPARTRGSRFRRIARFQIWRELGVGFGVGVVVLGLLFLSGLSKPLVAVATDNTALTVLAYLALLLVLASVVVIVRWATHNRVFLEKLSAGPATVSLATTQPTSYFDQYMDEIVYYFEQSGRDIVIFEDIDRFDEAHIFETLRALNTLLNGAEQVRYRRGHSRRQQRRRAKNNRRKHMTTELPRPQT